MRPICKTIRPTPAATEAVQRRMQAIPYFTRDEVTLWFAEYDQGLEPLNARRAADKLLVDLRTAGTIVLLSMNRGWSWRGAPNTPSDHRFSSARMHSSTTPLPPHPLPPRKGAQ